MPRRELRPAHIVATAPGEWRVLDDMRGWQDATGIETEIREDDRFLCRVQEFRRWAEGKRTLRMEFFYREMRRRTGLLMQADGVPEGDRWNFDAENRKRLPAGIVAPAPPRFEPDTITSEVMALVAARFAGHFGRVDGFAWPVTPEQAALALDDFIDHRLASFGDWQDAMKRNEPHLFHSLLSTSMNVGLLHPMVACRAAERAYRAGAVPLNAAEGFIRQIIGWREFVRGVYWLHMPEYGERNALGATRKLPWFYWSGETRMECMRQVIGQTMEHAHAHHIQRLMVTGNFALIAGLHPDEVDLWYMVVYADAYQWVEMPNTRGMVLHRRRRRGGLQAVCRLGRVHQSHERLLRRVPLRRPYRYRRARLPVQHALLGLHCPPRRTLRGQQSDGIAASQSGADGRGEARRDSSASGRAPFGDGRRGLGVALRAMQEQRAVPAADPIYSIRFRPLTPAAPSFSRSLRTDVVVTASVTWIMMMASLPK